MPRRGKGKERGSISSSDAKEEGRWHGMQEELRSLVRGIVHSFGKGGVRGSKGDPWLNLLSSPHALTFKGGVRLEECEAWLLRVEKVLESMACPEEHWIWLASFLLEGDADQWWRAKQRLMFLNVDLIVIAWKDFQGAFYEKFLPDHEREIG